MDYDLCGNAGDVLAPPAAACGGSDGGNRSADGLFAGRFLYTSSTHRDVRASLLLSDSIFFT